ncbi:MAG: hypothetical protein HC814_00585 [Rhodobacteraceae bacterium]|nr:hypothetical protein [Paracoccaceae bacterium]
MFERDSPHQKTRRTENLSVRTLLACEKAHFGKNQQTPRTKIRSAMKPSALRTLIATLALVAATSAFAQKKDPVSPNEPKVTICHNGHSITVAQSAVPAHLAHGDTIGPCANESKVVICHRGNTLTVPSSALSSHLAHGDTLGECSTVSRSEVVRPAASGLGNPALPQPVGLAKPITPSQPQTPQTPVTTDEIALCYKGQTVKSEPARPIQTYLSIGATLGACPQKQDATPRNEEAVETIETTKADK